ncbi:hypothetical protein BWQ96_09073 [Gracilariopsis chorda]|uniref:DUF547 domain-containing protein n=1 Tax=Gracilariopsis chorda TaxID=448386 RepID=A0A2V3IGQ4_9FLOR|nr:hypothetical protein BWQ96_09073 [Gracilariopsis chorda]|eukprot:PXF41218.1 hypothetical protein BWQ96_09073 [Gracilariopsis chorda]
MHACDNRVAFARPVFIAFRSREKRLLLPARPSQAFAKMHIRFGPFRLLNGRPPARSQLSPVSQSPPTAPDISAGLRKAIQLLYVEHISESGVDYHALKSSPQFAEYVAQTARLPHLDLQAALTSDAAKIAFFVNLYNALTQHAVVVCNPPPSNSFARLLFGISVGYRVGPFKLSLNDIENGILRANRSVSILPKPFGSKDRRLSLAVQNVDARIHFVLNCAATSCPPVLFLTADNLENALTTATRGFLANHDNFSVKAHTVSLSMIFRWYHSDFSVDGSDAGVLRYVVQHGDPKHDSVVQLKKLLDNSALHIAISWLPYDWSLNSSS